MADMRDAFRKAGHPAAANRPPKPAAPPKPPAPAGGVTQVEAVPEDYTGEAERVIKELRADGRYDYSKLTTSKLRNILAMVSNIYNDVRTQPSEALSGDIQGRIEYLKVRLAYECGREPRVIKPFVTKAKLLERIAGSRRSRKDFVAFARFMEALVAYHRFHGGRD